MSEPRTIKWSVKHDPSNFEPMATEWDVAGFDAFGNPVNETISVSASPAVPFHRRVLMRYAPGFMWNLWYRLGWTKWRPIKGISVQSK